ncbi:MAG: outer membrane protein assembly factor BamA [Bacteroidales bacterium]|nr:outer membrane protein assembly factor BamA [Bacteroidales bacterium]
MQKRLYLLFSLILITCSSLFAQADAQQDTIFNPSILYSTTPKKYEIAGISVTGVKNYEDYVLIGFSGLSVGQVIEIPGDDITNAIKRFWKQGLFSDVSISVAKIYKNQVWLDIKLQQRPRISQINYHGVKKSEREDLDIQLGLVKGNQITPNMVDRAKKLIKKYYDEKGFKNADVQFDQKDDLSNENQVIVDIVIDKKDKVKINEIVIEGNKVLSDFKLKRVMKKTNEKGKLVNLFRTKKYVKEEFENDKNLIIEKYNELGYRDATIVSDSIWENDEKTVNIKLVIDEGQKYYIRDIKFVGNKVYPSDYLLNVLQMKPGDVYNQKLLGKRLNDDEDGIGTLYMDQGYLFFNITPIEVNMQSDSIDLELRVMEGEPARINKVRIEGNDRLYEHVVRRELRTKPGELFSKTDLMRSARELAQTGHFNPENMDVKPLPDPENGTVDLLYALESKANDQIEFSAGWGQTGVIGKLSLKFTNFSVKNFLNPSTYKGIIPQGEGQTLTISGQTNARYYQSYSVSFYDPWFGGKRPNSFSVSAYYSRQTAMSSNYYSNNNYYDPYSYYNGYGYGNSSSSYEYSLDPEKYIQMLGASIGFGKRLNWPDDYFQFSAALSYQCYILKQWEYFVVTDGTSNNVNLELNVTRNSIDNPIYTRRGSTFSLSGTVTPPYSLFKNTDHYKDTELYTKEKLKWLEYYKIKFGSKTFTPLTSNNNTLVLMTRADMGFLGYYNKYKRSPFESYYMGGDGMSGYSSTYITETIPLRGYENGSITNNYTGYNVATSYARFVAELRFPFMLQPSSTIYGTAFVEAGNAWTSIKNFNPFSLKRSAGVGVRIFLPMIGMMGIDWAYGFDPVFGSRDSSGSNFHFVIGQEF